MRLDRIKGDCWAMAEVCARLSGISVSFCHVKTPQWWLISYLVGPSQTGYTFQAHRWTHTHLQHGSKCFHFSLLITSLGRPGTINSWETDREWVEPGRGFSWRQTDIMRERAFPVMRLEEYWHGLKIEETRHSKKQHISMASVNVHCKSLRKTLWKACMLNYGLLLV